MGTPIDIADLARRIETLEQMLGIRSRPIAPNPSPSVLPLKWVVPTKLPNACSTCGLDLTLVRGYVCGDARCPVQPKIT